MGPLEGCKGNVKRESRIACFYREPNIMHRNKTTNSIQKGIVQDHYRFLVAFLLFPPAFTAGARAPIPFSLCGGVPLLDASESVNEAVSSSSASVSMGFDDALESFLMGVITF
jgi:hypothetical protein